MPVGSIPFPRRLCRLLVALAAVLLVPAVAQARTGEVALTIVGDERMAEELTKLTQDLEKDQPLTGDSLALLQGAQARRARIATALRSRGYYDARVTATVASQPVDDAAALDAIEQRPEGEKITFAVNVATGPLYRVTLAGGMQASRTPMNGWSGWANGLTYDRRGRLYIAIYDDTQPRTIVRLESDDLVGWGEASPNAFYGETAERVAALLGAASAFARDLHVRSVADIERAWSRRPDLGIRGLDSI